MSGEHEIIRRYFAFAGGHGVRVGVGDDAAITRPPAGKNLAISTDTLNTGVHFFPNINAAELARLAATASLSDMAAMAAKPLWLTAALATPPQPRRWFAGFARGLRQAAKQHGCAVVGGDLTRASALSVCITAIGVCDDKPPTRGGARVGDEVWVSGRLGARAHWVGAATRQLPAPPRRAPLPTARVALGLALRGLAVAAIDLSDDLISCAKIIAAQSGAQLRLQASRVPAAAGLAKLPAADYWQCLLAGGEDYELLFVAPRARHNAVAALATRAVPLACIGVVARGRGVKLIAANGKTMPPPPPAYEHQFK